MTCTIYILAPIEKKRTLDISELSEEDVAVVISVANALKNKEKNNPQKRRGD